MENLGKILSISEVSDKDGYDGYEVVTDKTKISLLIKNYNLCCENWGYSSSSDDFEDFISSEVLSIVVVDEKLETINVPDDLYHGGIMFLNINTNQGTLQFAVYNSHNGYYGHEALVILGGNEFHEDYL